MYIGTLIGFFLFISIFMLMITEIKPVIIHFDLNSAARGAILKIETDGGITSETRQNIINGLNFDSYDPSKLTIEPEQDVTGSTKASYGANISIDLTYKYTHKEYGFSGFDIVSTEVTEPIHVHMSTTSKNAR